jgi:hypothetical protein
MKITHLVVNTKDEQYEIFQADFDGVLYPMGVVFSYKDGAIEYADFLNRQANRHE